MIEPNIVCADCGQPASRRSGIFNKVYRCQDCHAKLEKKSWLISLVGCGGCLGVLVLMLMMGSCGAAATLMIAKGMGGG